MKVSHEKHEVLDFVKKYWKEKCVFKDNKISDDEEKLIVNIVSNVDYIENFRPDGFSIIENDIYPIEHFQFDASIEKKGSQLSIKESIIDRKISNSNHTFSFQIDTKSDKYFYINNLIYHFEDHAKKIYEYKKNIIDVFPQKNIKDIVFFIEDKTIFGAIYDDKTPFQIVKTKEFIEIWKKYSEIKYIVFYGSILSSKYCMIYSNIILNDNYPSIEDIDINILNSTHGVSVREEIKWKK